MVNEEIRNKLYDISCLRKSRNIFSLEDSQRVLVDIWGMGTKSIHALSYSVMWPISGPSSLHIQYEFWFYLL